jgi:chromate transporter
LGLILTIWVTFVPCFFWIFLGAPYIERLRDNRLLSSALSAVTAAVVGVIMNLAVWFSLHTLFARVDTETIFGLRLLVPDLASANLASIAIALFAILMTFYWKKGMLVTLASSAALGAVIHYAAALMASGR